MAQDWPSQARIGNETRGLRNPPVWPNRERIRYWTNLGLIVPDGELNPGHGRKRLYDQSVLTKAETLNRLTDAGISAAILRDIPTFMDSGGLSGIVSKSAPVYLAIKKLQNKKEPEFAVYTRYFFEENIYKEAEYTIVVKIG